ncbi:MAG: hypothetical protein MPW15_07835 [Candidatus Manganitrophus sp.]|nr:hypothetical protein [Candidatus Manganitrophus sp.]
MFRFQLKWFQFLLVLLTVLVANQAAIGDESGRDGNLEIYIHSDKPIYKFGEPIQLTIRLKNNTTGPLVVNRRLDPFSDLKWELFAEPNGFMQVKTSPPKPLTADDFIELKPEEEIRKKLPPLSEITPDPLKRGLYGLRVTYASKEKPNGVEKKGKDIWTGEIITNRLSIQIRSSEKASL